MTPTPPTQPTWPDTVLQRRLHALSQTGLMVGLVCLSACAALPTPEPKAAAELPTRWQSPTDAQAPSTDPNTWWQQFNDPVLTQLIAQTQSNNPSLAQAAARIEQARALASAAGAPLWPGLNARAGTQRLHDTSLSPAGSTYTVNSAGLDASWEVDLFGAHRHSRLSALERVRGSEWAWRDVRLSLAAEVANTYVAYRSCEALLGIFQEDAQSLRQTAALTQQKTDKGFEAPANAALADAGSAEATNRAVAQRAECDVALKSLVALTLYPEPKLRETLRAPSAPLPMPAAFAIMQVPAQALAQRPDLAAAQRDIAATVADIGRAEADRWPRLSLIGSIGRSQVRVNGVDTEGTTWSIGPSLIAPLFDAGARKAHADAQRARYDEAQAAWHAKALAAVREVEEALVRLDATERRQADAQRAAQGYATFFKAAEAQWQVGAISLLDLEQARRSALNAKANLIQVQRERIAAWLSLHKAVGGDWPAGPPAHETAAAPPTSPHTP